MRIRRSKEQWAEILIGNRFGNLVVSSYEGLCRLNANHLWRCVCDCGKSFNSRAAPIMSGRTVSCGCFQKRRMTTHGKSYSKTYFSWRCMINRCKNPKDLDFHNYGGRGIFVCDRWKQSFENFLEDMGEKPVGMSLDRVDSNGNYEKNNCRWADAKTQANNRRKKERKPA